MPASDFKIVADAKPGEGYVLRGDNRAMISAKEHEVILSGPADTGKSMTCCVKLHLVAARYPGCQISMVRKTAASIAGTIARTFARVIAGQRVRVLGASKPSQFIYENGSTIYIGGLDNPDKILSGERDVIYVCQAEELTLDDWETLATRCSGRGAIVRTPQLMGDCNPGGSRHWIRLRAAEGKLRLLVARHEDNPTLYDERGVLINTPEVKRRMEVLNNLSGIRRKRLLEGVWATSEGAVYEMFDAAVHVKERQRNEMKRFFLAVDEGFTNPAVVLDIGEDSDGRWHVFREFYERNVLPENHCAVVASWWSERQYEVAAVDESAAGMIASLQSVGVIARGGKGRVNDGIAKIQNRLKVQGDGKPRMTIDPSCVELVNELESYVWRPEKDVPVKENDHACDALRYLADVLNEPDGALTEESLKGTEAGGSIRPWGVTRTWPGRGVR